MTNVTNKKVGRMVYLDFETDQKLQAIKTPSMSTSAFYGMIIEEAFNMRNPV
ncbi:hypothetical protein [Methanosarcina sp.]|uniref:hypothetical protein n=1 Tax=Methanosarcina sp. TaxID=2213 RepID=UPI003C76259A